MRRSELSFAWGFQPSFVSKLSHWTEEKQAEQFPCHTLLHLSTDSSFKTQQAGNGPSRRHIQGSKIAKGLQISKYW